MKAEDYGVSRLFQFAKSCFTKAASIRNGMGLTKDFVAIHWRSERTECKYNACSQELAAGIQNINKRDAPNLLPTQSRCLLVSDIPVNQNRSLWGNCLFLSPYLVCAWVVGHSLQQCAVDAVGKRVWA